MINVVAEIRISTDPAGHFSVLDDDVVAVDDLMVH